MRGEFPENAIRKDLLPTEVDAIRRTLEPMEREAARERQASTQFGGGGNFPPPDAGKTRDKIGAFAGVSGRIVETACRFAGDLIVQETGWRYLRDGGVTLIAADSPDSFLDETPMAVLIRRSPRRRRAFEKRALVAKLRKARERKNAETGKCGGRKSVAKASPETVALAK